MPIEIRQRSKKTACTLLMVQLVGLSLWCGCQTGNRSSSLGPPPDASFVLPGAFSEQTTVADFEAMFGAANVKIETETDSTGTYSSVVLFPDDPERRAYVRFHDEIELLSLALISVTDRGSRWRGKHGVHIGMSLAELEKVNGKPFCFAGFDSLGRGWAHDQWSVALDYDNGLLGTLDVEEGENMYFGVELGLRGSGAAIPPDAYPHDQYSFLSDDRTFPRLGEIVEVTGINATTSLDDEW